MRCSNLEVIKEFEGYSHKAYKDVAGIWTIGYGHTPSKEGEEISECQAEHLLFQDVEHCEDAINKIIEDNDLQLFQNQFDALVSFAYNLGTGVLRRSTLLKYLIKDEDDYRIYAEFCRFINAGGRPYKGLLRRRIKEAELFFQHKEI